MSRDSLFRFTRVFILAFAMLLASHGIASAHAALLKSEPAAGSRLVTSPTRIWLLFSEEMEASVASITLKAGDGRVITLKTAGDPHDVHAIVGQLDPLANGEYIVTWRAISADGHPVAGSFSFIVANATAPAAASQPMPAPQGVEDVTWGPALFGAPVVSATLRGLAMGALMILGGLLFFMSWEDANLRESHVRVARAIRWSAYLSVAFLTLHALAWMMNAIPEHHLSMDVLVAVLHTSTGKMEIWRTGFALLALLAMVFARLRLATMCALVSLAISGGSGHAAAITPLLATPMKALHLIGGAAWIGGLLWLILSARTDHARFLAWTARVSQLALAAVIVVALSGIVQTLLFLPSVAAVFTSAYGAVALAKTAGLLVLVGFGAYHRYRVLPALEQRADSASQFATTLRIEMAVMFGVILLGGLLAYMPPPRQVASTSPSHSTVQ